MDNDYRRSVLQTRLARLRKAAPETAGPAIRSRLRGHFGLLSERTERSIHRHYRCGERVESLARRFQCTKASVGWAIGRIRVQRIMALPLEFIASEEFGAVSCKAQEQAILAPPPREAPAERLRVPPDLPPYLAGLYEIPPLSRAQEVHLFRKMNYLKYKASRLRNRLDPARPKTALMNRIDRLHDEAVSVKNAIVSANLRLVVSIARRYVAPGDALFELVSDGNLSLIRAAEKFDVTRGNSFSTYAARAISADFARAIPTKHHRGGGQHNRGTHAAGCPWHGVTAGTPPQTRKARCTQHRRGSFFGGCQDDSGQPFTGLSPFGLRGCRMSLFIDPINHGTPGPRRRLVTIVASCADVLPDRRPKRALRRRVPRCDDPDANDLLARYMLFEAMLERSLTGGPPCEELLKRL